MDSKLSWRIRSVKHRTNISFSSSITSGNRMKGLSAFLSSKCISSSFADNQIDMCRVNCQHFFVRICFVNGRRKSEFRQGLCHRTEYNLKICLQLCFSVIKIDYGRILQNNDCTCGKIVWVGYFP